jgi:predicted AlkP superfamily pyrophosphatase or phosphodiesterase
MMPMPRIRNSPLADKKKPRRNGAKYREGVNERVGGAVTDVRGAQRRRIEANPNELSRSVLVRTRRLLVRLVQLSGFAEESRGGRVYGNSRRTPDSSRCRPRAAIFTALVACFALAGCVHSRSQPEIRLVLTITVDQLRGDVLSRYQDRFTADPGSGFGYLQNHGVVFSDANFDHATTFTAVGHATLFTGAEAAVHGITGNAWLVGNQAIWAVTDTESPILDGTGNGSGSPRNLLVGTLGDALIERSARPARVFSVSTKDRSAILSGGLRGKAFWFDKESGRYVTSRYYYDGTPVWLEEWNALGKVWEYRDQSWDLLEDRDAYPFADDDDAPWEPGIEHQGNRFPHALGRVVTEEYLSALRFTPMADELTLDVVYHLIDAERVGQRDGTDMLAVSLSATDYVGHAFGPSSLEAEDNLFRLDRGLRRLLDFVDARIGLDHTLIVLTADHGIPEIPERYIAKGIDSGRIDIDRLQQRVRAGLGTRFDTSRNLLVGFSNPALFLDRSAIADLHLDLEEVQAVAAEIARREAGIEQAIPASDIAAGRIANRALAAMLKNSFHPDRSGDVILIQKRYWYLHPGIHGYATMHGSPYRYDTHIPLIFVVPGVQAKLVTRPVHAVDMAPTVARILGVEPLEDASGDVLTEALPAVH